MKVLGQHVHDLTAEQLDVYQKVSTVHMHSKHLVNIGRPSTERVCFTLPIWAAAESPFAC
jgi:hypothetical protein